MRTQSRSTLPGSTDVSAHGADLVARFERARVVAIEACKQSVAIPALPYHFLQVGLDARDRASNPLSRGKPMQSHPHADLVACPGPVRQSPELLTVHSRRPKR